MPDDVPDYEYKKPKRENVPTNSAPLRGTFTLFTIAVRLAKVRALHVTRFFIPPIPIPVSIVRRHVAPLFLGECINAATYRPIAYQWPPGRFQPGQLAEA
jgi:hypothetical protein